MKLATEYIDKNKERFLEELFELLSKACSEEGIRTACEEMISRANSLGGTDNITAVIISVAAEE